jgi:hypothetical protein
MYNNSFNQLPKVLTKMESIQNLYIDYMFLEQSEKMLQAMQLNILGVYGTSDVSKQRLHAFEKKIPSVQFYD